MIEGISRFADLLKSGDVRAIAIELVELERSRGAVSISELSTDPFAALEDSDEVTLVYNSTSPEGCSVSGYYRPTPPTIFVHAALSSERDNFTVLHEYGHHVQRVHLEWADVWLSLPDAAGATINEAVADAFAVEVLMPLDRAPLDAGPLRAQTIRDAYSRCPASRQALLMRAVQLAPPDERAVAVISELDGRVMFALSTCDEPRPRRGAVQAGLTELIAEATHSGGVANGPLREGLCAASGWNREDLVAEVAIDTEGRYAFAVIRPQTRYQFQRWQKVTHECFNEACGANFDADESLENCHICRVPKCPTCGQCACERPANSRCPNCYLELSSAEQIGAVEHECF
ncbi:putative Zn peptidase [Mycobacteroides abscessus subsp. massiliense]|uniref:ImmA/IrrE family metallo-endopeptidase n=1 Tax=Mycobacteroides abscessus TaxID=36809 RepID=UPI0009D1DA9D|nr:putative Zn peptidase [Mycobacteroides abscessus subsp. massiliense]SKH81164.1 putative Zn peptidase [Mycobacteroides abscessus subsp. massiliense]SKI09154.1 putative Zn peptidase [Mycobacteroides abscessus subsp. massiliense]SKK14746.1 putative Zn peptidase [Mycobacteroides abscessus subsp. massiliense]